MNNQQNFKVQSRIQKLIGNISQDFELAKLSKSPARFNTEKLNWFNREYIKMLSLEEFCLRASKLNAESQPKDTTYRVGDYVYLVDLESQKVLINKSTSAGGQDGLFYCVGGGRDPGEDGKTGVVRETAEETGGVLKLDQSKLKFIQKVCVDSGRTWNRDGQDFQGKEFNFWFYPLKQSEMQPFHLEEDVNFDHKTSHENWDFLWYDLSEVILTNDFLTFPIWQQFCFENNLPCFEIDDKVKQQYLAWNLDKNRAVLLSEFGSESSCILRFETPDKETLKWKKISLDESLANLGEIQSIINKLYQKFEDQRKALYSANIDQLPTEFQKLAQNWETELKNWLSQNNKDAGSYFWPLRVALSGKAKSPSPFEILAILSQEQAVSRIISCASK
jgi:glutamyl/glutaminyl-tRNA synthetase